MIWFIGDNAIEPAVVALAAERAETLVVSATANATPEEVWTAQKHDAHPKWKDVTVILYLPQQDYDSEATMWQIFSKISKGKVLYCMSPNSPFVADGLRHYETDRIIALELDSLDTDTVLNRLRAA